MNALTNEFTTMCRRHQKAVRSAEQAVDEMLQLLAEVSEMATERDTNGTSACKGPAAISGTESGNEHTAMDDVTDKSAGQHYDERILKTLQQLHARSKALQSALVSDHKAVGTSINKYGKAIDAATEANLSTLCAPGVKLEACKMNYAVCNHLFREGLFDIGQTFMSEARLSPPAGYDDEHVTPFEQLFAMLTAFRARDLRPCIDWVDKHASQMPPPVATDLQFRLHVLGYLQVVEAGCKSEALDYAQTHLSKFPAYIGIIQKLMTCLLYSGDLANSPYRGLIHPFRAADVENVLVSEYCRLKGLSKTSLLLTVVNCGTKAIPMLLKATKIASNLHELGMDDALPVEIDIGRDCFFHSIFTCPVSKEEASDGNNVPMILPCGHVLSKQSIMRLPRGTQRFKCPYCPMEQSIDECRELYI